MDAAAAPADLSAGWALRCSGDAAPPEVRSAEVTTDAPASVHTALLAAELIDEPYRGGAWEKLRWIGRCGWSWTRRFAADPDGPALELVLAGVDGPAEVLLNGGSLGRCENGFRPHAFDLGERLRRRNTLEVRFAPPTGSAVAAAEGPHPIAMPGITPYNGVRKMACGFGWDWAPPLDTCGLSGAVTLRPRDAARIDALAVSTESADRGRNAVVSATVRGSNAAGERVRLRLSDPTRGVVAAGEATLGDDGVATATLRVREPAWWWPRGCGEQPLYELTATLRARTADGTVTRRVGLRTVEIDRSPDDPAEPAAGTRFAVRVNGREVFCRGFNWIPSDTLLDRVDPATTQARLDEALAAGANAIRVWGGGVAESDAFFDRCDEEGILVWQDFPFACAMYDEAQLAGEVREEATHLADRLAWRPSLALWCGGNECLWFHRSQPGWAEAVGDTGWGEGFYGELLPEAVAERSPGSAYVINSPSGRSLGSPADDENHGPQHPWDAWNREPGEAYLRTRPRFAAEFGFCGAAHAQTLRWATPGVPEADRSEAAWGFLMATRGRAKMEARLDEVFGRAAVPGPDDPPLALDAWVYATQLMQSRAVELGAGWYRSLQPRCSGTLVWQLQDSWPAVSWSVIDFFGRRKLAWYGSRRSMGDHAAALLAAENDPANLAFVRFAPAGWSRGVPVRLRAVDAAGEELASADVPLRADPAATAEILLRAAVPAELTAAAQESGGLVVADDPTLGRRVWAPAPDHAMHLPEPRFDLAAERSAGTLAVTVTAHTLLRDAVVDPGPSLADAPADEQTRTLLPGETALFRFPLARERAGVPAAGPRLFSANAFSGRGRREATEPRTAATADPMSVRSADS
ncbi:glycoside hydrolase family 2 protein [Phycisphaera mikurensis]|uniref:beta-mannosidase n=1 Tax=Phycisphaera mikurensis (strain NBRC 102666 / KCTC 22515 / FYK2301M01) TaxID=1142394 RepID=I0IDH4_PHYMF|nr:putative beta-mannosidase [Phycisphaera mikurensis]MBB6441133.1 beta-mannosidase [Phycisphaera mikurensis]BAM03312.1 putative beta-mannosidase [Phycisphaera mikurensis NBRC 102666]